MLKDEKGSMVVEAAIVFPIVLLVVLVLITLSIVVHDIYVSRLLIDVIDEESHQVNISSEISERVLGKHIIKSSVLYDSVKKNEGMGKDEVIRKSIASYEIPWLGVKSYRFNKLLYNEELIKKVMIIEMSGDIFDDFTISKLSKDKYKQLIKSVLAGLKND